MSPYDEGIIIVTMEHMPFVVAATPLNGYRVRIRFDDGLEGDVDLSYLRNYGGVFEALKDPEYFRRLRADKEIGTITWPNDADVSPDTLYEKASRAATGPA